MNYLQMKKKALGGGWWVDPSCVGAYCFKGVRSEAEALRDMTGAGHDLTAIGSPVWSSSDGYRVSIFGKYLNNEALNGLDIKTVICRYANMSESGHIVNFSCFHGASGAGELCGIIDYRYFVNGEWRDAEYDFPAFVTKITSTGIEYRRPVAIINPLPADGGIFAGSPSGLWINGEEIQSTFGGAGFDANMLWIENGIASVGVGEKVSQNDADPCNVLSIAFYTEELDDMTHKVVAANMNRF